ncbi:DEAD/DEAH box helicase [Plantactinospora sp. ZYX-F-223]|uniref:DEAD/DEAH box helicase n=1 Tax=Plantactinospora sp. ZYX-F-223 TaxID=3144103 RepID=UPI0031FBE076
MQRDAVPPLLAGEDAILLAPTAGGKTEAAAFPLLARMTAEQWTGTSVLYLCPLKALLNNLLPRLERYAGWLGRRAAVWHGDVTASRRRAVLWERPDILLTTPESLESMLVSVNVDHRLFFAGLRAVVVDEAHAFAGDDRGWHLLAVLERLTHLVGRPLQRVGLSATVGNPDQLLAWLQGSGVGNRPGRVVAPEPLPRPAAAGAVMPGPPPGDIELDYVDSLDNVATVIAALHAGEKRLVFCESRQTVEELGQLLRAKGLTTFLSHASLSADERIDERLAPEGVGTVSSPPVTARTAAAPDGTRRCRPSTPAGPGARAGTEVGGSSDSPTASSDRPAVVRTACLCLGGGGRPGKDQRRQPYGQRAEDHQYGYADHQGAVGERHRRQQHTAPEHDTGRSKRAAWRQTCPAARVGVGATRSARGRSAAAPPGPGRARTGVGEAAGGGGIWQAGCP